MANQWTWETVTEGLAGEWREFIRLCNRRLKDLQVKVASLVSYPVGGGTANVLSRWDSTGTGLADSGWSDSGSLLTAARPVDLGGTLGGANFVPAYPSAPVNGTYMVRVLGSITSSGGDGLAVHTAMAGGGSPSGFISSPVFNLSANGQSVYGVITGPRITPGSYTGAVAYGLLVQGPRDTAGAAIAAGVLDSTAYGILVDDINAGSTTNYAIKTGVGRHSFGDDIEATGGFVHTIHGWYQDNVTASQTNVELVHAAGRWTAVRAGSILGVVVHATEARTAGTLTVTVFKNTGLAGAAGSSIGLTAVLNGTDTSRKATTQAKDTDTFAAGDELYAVVTTDGSWTPTTSDIRVSLLVEC